MEFEIIKADEVPQAPKPASKRAQEVLDMLDRIPKGQAVRITPPAGTTVKGTRISISRVISNKKLVGYEVSGDDQFAYVTRKK